MKIRPNAEEQMTNAMGCALAAVASAVICVAIVLWLIVRAL